MENQSMKLKKILAALAFSPVAALAEGETNTGIPGLSGALTTAEQTASTLAGQVIPSAVTILFAFAGLLGVYLIWRVFKKGVSGR